ncbi:excalibur calcium-binding domain-containing protein [Arthrobacter sp. MYb227]|uniref:excalibur calcium-binding domain-containing protein n=1 Tax=Arthrobacter sp. MYb227 TaxID=1848601 RepID=UPI00269673F0|nr:excalibur calcium-binding domain-containing protein [Arthrobacter sp. MYb227]
MSQNLMKRKRKLGWKGWTGIGVAVLILSACVNGSDGTAEKAQPENSEPAPAIAVEEPTAAPTAEAAALLKDFEGKTCDGDELVMDQGNESLFCDFDGNGLLIWVSAANHKLFLEQAEAAAKAKSEVEANVKAQAEALQELERKEKAAAEKKELTITKAAPTTSAASPSVRSFVAPKPVPTPKPTVKATPKPTPKATPKPTPKATPKPTPKPTPKSSGSAYYKNCSAVRAAGKAPIYRGEPGYSRKLDRDGDGVACE